MPNLESVIQQSVDNTVSPPLSWEQTRTITWLTRAGLNMYPWWSPARDMQLRSFWKNSDHLSGAMYTLCSKMTSIPMRIQARDQSVKEHVLQAEEATYKLNAGAEWGAGWPVFYNKFVEELAGTDNGVFAEIIGAGNADGPIIGAPITVRILDSAACQRTGDPFYPVLYRDMNGKMYKLHYTRVMFLSQMPSPIADMFNVGFSAISRAINVAQNLIDVLTYKQEKLGSRPHRGVIVTGGGLDPEDVAKAFESIAHDMDNQALSRYSKIAVVGSSTIPDASLNMTDLAGLPDNFDERTSVELGMATIALAFGMDARELFPSLTAGSTRADALIQHLKQRGKGPGQIVQQTELIFNSKYLPPHLEMVFDYQDDEQDRQAAETKEVRSRRWATAVKSTAMDNRTVRQQMLDVGDLSQNQFEELELNDGRLPDGTSVLGLFYSNDPTLKKMLDLGQQVDPLDIETSNATSVLASIRAKKAEVHTIIVNSRRPDERKDARRALAALDALEKLYTGEDEEEPQTDISNDDLTQVDGRTRHVDLQRPKLQGFEADELEPDSDDGAMKEAGREADYPFRWQRKQTR